MNSLKHFRYSIVFLDLKIGEETTLRCEGDGNPEPRYEWQQLVDSNDPSMTKILRRSNDTILRIRSVSSVYLCKRPP